MDYLDRYTVMLSHKNKRYELVDGQLFIRKERWIAPMGPAAQAYRLNRRQCRELLSKLGGFWIQWTDGFRPHCGGSEWYAVICRRHTSIEEIASGNTRSKIRRGLKNCDVKQVDAQEIAKNGYETYCAAIKSYGNRPGPLPSAEEFARRVLTDESFCDIRPQWAVYRDGKMIAFAQNLIYDTIEVDYTMIKLHPEYLKYYPAYALLYKMNEYYLAQKRFQYVNDGFRSISHETGIQDFLIRKFGFEKAHTGLHVHYRAPFGHLLRAVRPFRATISALYPRTAALFELDRLRTREGQAC